MASSKNGRTTPAKAPRKPRAAAAKAPQKKAVIAVKRAGGLPRKGKASVRDAASPVATHLDDVRAWELALDISHLSAVLQAASAPAAVSAPELVPETVEAVMPLPEAPRPEDVFLDTPPAELELLTEAEAVTEREIPAWVVVAEAVIVTEEPIAAADVVEEAVIVAEPIAVSDLLAAEVAEPVVVGAVAIEPAVVEALMDEPILVAGPTPVAPPTRPAAPASGGWLLSKLRRWAGLRL